jgi:predicted acetyltransferase
MPTALVVPDLARLPSYVEALSRGFLPSNINGDALARRHADAIARDADDFVASLTDVEAKGPPITMPDGTTTPRLPGLTRWIVDGDAFCGLINLRWSPGRDDLPPHVLGHVGYVVAPWLRGLGHARRALALLLPIARGHGLGRIDLSTDPDNGASQKVILANGGVLIGPYVKPAAYGAAPALLYRITL